MKIYVSGKITGLPIEEAKQRFADSQALLESIGFEVVNPLEFGLCDEKASWESHMVKDIELLFGCDAIYMMDNWTGSTGAGIEYDIAFRLGKDIWFESSFARDNRNVMRIQNAIHEVIVVVTVVAPSAPRAQMTGRSRRETLATLRPALPR